MCPEGVCPEGVCPGGVSTAGSIWNGRKQKGLKQSQRRQLQRQRGCLPYACTKQLAAQHTCCCDQIPNQHPILAFSPFE